MSSRPLLLSGEASTVIDDSSELRAEIALLKRENHRLDEALRQERNRVGAIEAGARDLRHTLTPLYRALQKVFGDLDEMGVEAGYSASNAASPQSEAWELWKQKLPGFPSRMIDALLKHGELSVAQLVVAAQCPRKQTIYDAASKMQKLGLLNSSGGKYSLKQL